MVSARMACRFCFAMSRGCRSDPKSAAASPNWTARAKSLAASSSCVPARTRSRRSGTSKAEAGRLEHGLPQGVEIVTTYDRSALIERAVAQPPWKLIEEFIIVALVCAVFLFHVRSALVAIVSSARILLAFVVMQCAGDQCQHHVARRYRDRHRRDGRRGDRDDRERAQAHSKRCVTCIRGTSHPAMNGSP